MVIWNSGPRFPKKNSCLTILIDLYNDMINLGDERGAVDAVYLHFRKKFDCVPQDPHEKSTV